MDHREAAPLYARKPGESYPKSAQRRDFAWSFIKLLILIGIILAFKHYAHTGQMTGWFGLNHQGRQAEQEAPAAAPVDELRAVGEDQRAWTTPEHLAKSIIRDQQGRLLINKLLWVSTEKPEEPIRIGRLKNNRAFACLATQKIPKRRVPGVGAWESLQLFDPASRICSLSPR